LKTIFKRKSLMSKKSEVVIRNRSPKYQKQHEKIERERRGPHKEKRKNVSRLGTEKKTVERGQEGPIKLAQNLNTSNCELKGGGKRRGNKRKKKMQEKKSELEREKGWGLRETRKYKEKTAKQVTMGGRLVGKKRNG